MSSPSDHCNTRIVTEQLVLQAVEQLQKDSIARSAELATLVAQTQRLRAQNEQLQHEMTETLRQVTAAYSTPRRKPLPMQTFTGDRQLFRSWRVYMEHKIRADEGFYGGPEAQYHYIWVSLGTDVQRAVSHYYVSGGPGGRWDPGAFLEYLGRLYDRPAASGRRSGTRKTG